MNDLAKRSTSALSAEYDALQQELRRRDDHGWRKNPNRVATIVDKLLEPEDYRGKRVLDLGAGTRNPLGSAALAWMRGAEAAFAVDIEELNGANAAFGLLLLVTECLKYPEKFRVDLDRVRAFDIAALDARDARGALRDVPVTYMVSGSEEWRALRDIDIVISQSVLEHVRPFAAVASDLRAKMRDGAVGRHVVDFNDHRRRITGDRWQFLVQESEHAATHCNRIRLEEMTGTLAEVGFAVEIEKRFEASPPADLRERLLPDFRNLSDKDLATVAAHLRLVAV